MGSASNWPCGIRPVRKSTIRFAFWRIKASVCQVNVSKLSEHLIGLPLTPKTQFRHDLAVIFIWPLLLTAECDRAMDWGDPTVQWQRAGNADRRQVWFEGWCELSKVSSGLTKSLPKIKISELTMPFKRRNKSKPPPLSSAHRRPDSTWMRSSFAPRASSRPAWVGRTRAPVAWV